MSKRTKRTERREKKQRLVCYACQTAFNPDQFEAHHTSPEHQENVSGYLIQMAVDKVYPKVVEHPCSSLILRLGDPRRMAYVRA